MHKRWCVILAWLFGSVALVAGLVGGLPPSMVGLFVLWGRVMTVVFGVASGICGLLSDRRVERVCAPVVVALAWALAWTPYVATMSEAAWRTAHPANFTVELACRPVAGREATTADMERTSRILRIRLESIRQFYAPEQTSTGWLVKLSLSSTDDRDQLIPQLAGGYLSFHLTRDAAVGGEAPAGYAVRAWHGDVGHGIQSLWVKDIPELTGEHVTTATVGFGESGLARVEVTFDQIGATQFANITGTHQGQRLAIVLNSQTILSAPLIRERIGTGGVVIDGLSAGDAAQLAASLRYGGLSHPIIVVGEHVL